jgi:diguanylate cyclase (GGDEF)-like protein/PAS domain S-box-containing protein
MSFDRSLRQRANMATRQPVKHDLLRLAFERMPLNMLMTTVGTLLFTGLWWNTFPHRLLVVWGVAILTFNVVIRFVLWSLFRRWGASDAEVIPWAKFYLIQTALAGSAWGFGPALIMRQSVETEAALLVAMLFAVCGVAINTLSAQRTALQAFIVTAMLPPALSAWGAPGGTGALVAYTLLGGAAVLSIIGQNTSNATWKLVATQLRMRSILETALDAAIEADANDTITDWNPRAETMFGWSKSEVLGRSLTNTIIPAQYRAAHSARMARYLESGHEHDKNRLIELTALRRDGTEFPLEMAVTAVRIGSGWQFFVFAADISERKLHAQALKDSEQSFRNLIELSPEAISVVRDGVNHYVNPAAIEMFGALDADQLIGKPALGWVHPEFRATFLQGFTPERPKDDWVHTFEAVFLKVDGTPFDVSVQSKLLVYGGHPAIYMSMRDITQSRKADEATRIAATAFESQQGMTITDTNNVILRVNRAFTDITGYSAQEAVGQTPRLLSSGRHDHLFYQSMWQDILRTGKWQGEIWNRHKDGNVFPEWLTVTAVTNEAGQVTHYVGAFSDISQKKEAESQIKNLAFYDPLTELPNRRLLLDRLEQALAAGARHKKVGALLFIDLDNFKNINDTLGHQKGDLLLQQVAKRLCASVREGDTVSRLGGDEFVLMLEEMGDTAPEAAAQAEVVGAKLLQAIGATYVIHQRECRTSPSIGVALFTGQTESVDELLKRADMAMYQAKAAGRNTVRFFDPQMQAVVETNAVMESDLRQALSQQQLSLFYQAQVAPDGSIVGAEALVRWHHPVKGMISPGVFIPVAEQTGLILPLGEWVLETACKQINLWSEQTGLCKLTVSVNVSALQFRQPDFVDQVVRILTDTKARPQGLKLELTESLLVKDVEDIIGKMTALKARGVEFSLDDFGTGYSSLAYLSRLPLAQLKIDQGFVRDIESSENAVAICAATISLAHSLKMKVVAEGVETGAQRYFLGTVHRCDLMQGYLFSRPVPLGEFEQLARTMKLG